MLSFVLGHFPLKMGKLKLCLYIRKSFSLVVLTTYLVSITLQVTVTARPIHFDNMTLATFSNPRLFFMEQTPFSLVCVQYKIIPQAHPCSCILETTHRSLHNSNMASPAVPAQSASFLPSINMLRLGLSSKRQGQALADPHRWAKAEKGTWGHCRRKIFKRLSHRDRRQRNESGLR